MDHIITDEQRRTDTLAHLDDLEAKVRASVAKALLSTLENHSRHLTRADQHDRAYAIWAEFYGDGGRTESIPDELLAGVFVQASKWLDQSTIMTLARNVWGDRPFDAVDGEDRVQWMPEDATAILTVRHLLSDGTPAVANVVVTDTKIAGAMR